eukprot:s6994_g1.t1
MIPPPPSMPPPPPGGIRCECRGEETLELQWAETALDEACPRMALESEIGSEHFLGAGCFGCVYLGRLQAGEEVAVKVPRADGPIGPASLRREGKGMVVKRAR